MISRYKQVGIDDASAGMVLADEVCDRQGNVLLAKGTQLSDSTLAALRRRGVEGVRVEDDGVSPEQLAAAREEVAVRVGHLFRAAHGGAADAFLREQITAYRMEQLQ
jgi:hypothetical protein